MKERPNSLLHLSASALAALAFATSGASQAVQGHQPRAASGGCASSIADAAMPGSCLEASSVPALGKLYPLSESFRINALGNVGLGHIPFPGSTLTVGGVVAVTDDDPFVFLPDIGFGPVEDGTGSFGDTFGAFETFGSFGNPATLVSTVTGFPNAGAMATRAFETAAVQTFNTLLTVPVGQPTAGYVSVLSNNSETAGINGATGIVFGAAKSFVQPHPEDAGKEIRYVSLEGPEHGVYFRGSSRLVGGAASIEVPESFRLVAREEGLTVSITPTGPSRGLYVAEKGLDGIEVRENPGGEGAVSFDYLVHGVRSAMPDLEPIQANRRFSPAPGRRLAPTDLPGHYQALMVRNGTLNADGSVNEATAVSNGWGRDAEGRWKGGRGEAAPIRLRTPEK